MPYLTNTSKQNIQNEEDLQKQAEYSSKLTLKDFLGYLNYKNFVLVKAWINKNGCRYYVLASIIGTLICCVFEIYRRIVAPYEDSAIEKNGDVE